jgi:hypothetical protein
MVPITTPPLLSTDGLALFDATFRHMFGTQNERLVDSTSDVPVSL